MRSILVFILWLIATIVMYLVTMPWTIFVSLPMMVWMTFKNTSVFDVPDWTMPWFVLQKTQNAIRKLDPTIKSKE